MNKHKHNIPQTKNYSTLFSKAGKAWASALERLPKKYGRNSSGRTKQAITPELNHHSIHGRRSRPLGRALPTLNGRQFSSSQAAGFTVIEVVLVLAIAGLIFLMVFITLPALQRSQRDALRKQQANTLRDAMTRRATNNKGLLEGGKGIALELEDWVSVNYLKETEMNDPSTGELYRKYSSAWGGPLHSNFRDIPIGLYGADTGGYCEGNEPRDYSSSDPRRHTAFVYVFWS